MKNRRNRLWMRRPKNKGYVVGDIAPMNDFGSVKLADLQYLRIPSIKGDVNELLKLIKT